MVYGEETGERTVRKQGCGARHHLLVAFFGGTLSQGSDVPFAALQQLSPPADTQVSSRCCSQGCQKSLLLFVPVNNPCTWLPSLLFGAPQGLGGAGAQPQRQCSPASEGELVSPCLAIHISPAFSNCFATQQ